MPCFHCSNSIGKDYLRFTAACYLKSVTHKWFIHCEYVGSGDKDPRLLSKFLGSGSIGLQTDLTLLANRRGVVIHALRFLRSDDSPQSKFLIQDPLCISSSGGISGSSYNELVSHSVP